MRVDFYHLTRAPLNRVLPQIAERVVRDGGRLLIVEGDEEVRAGLDRLLWSYAPESFLPHARAGGPADADQPILLAGEVNARNGARNVALTDGEWRDEALAFDRAFHFFGEEAIQPARAAWRSLAKHGDVERHYWKQDEAGRWAEGG